MTRGRGKNAPDRSDEAIAVPIDELVSLFRTPMPPAASAMLDMVLSSKTAASLLKPEDMPIVEQMCMMYQVWSDARASYEARPVETRTRERTLSGWKRNSDIDTMKMASDQMVKLAKQIGFSPVARATLNLTNAASASMMATAFPDRVRAMFEAANGEKK